jgi:hypothetical protein
MKKSSIYTNCDNLLFDISDLNKDFWGRQITKEDFRNYETFAMILLNKEFVVFNLSIIIIGLLVS